MKIKKTINFIVAIFAITIFLIATSPRLFAEYYSIYEGQSREIKFNNLNSPVTITGAYKELIDLSTGKVLAQSPIYDNSENPIYLNPNNEYRINIYFTASKDISNIADIGSSLVVNAINSQNTLMPLGAYYNHNEVIKDLKLSITESESGQEKYKYTYSYIIDSEVFKEIERVSSTYNEKPKNYTLTIGEWAKINSINIQTTVYKVGDAFDIDGYTLTIKEIKANTTPPGLKHEVTISISGNNLNAIETYESGDNIFENYLNTNLKVNTVYSSRITLDKETLSTTDNSDYISFSNYADIAVKITDKPLPQTDSKYTYKLEIPCAIDKTKIILPAKIDPNYTGQYKTICNSSSYFNAETKTHHLKKNEGYYLDLTILTEKNNFSEIETATINFYNEYNQNACFTRKLFKSSTKENLFVGKISSVKGNDSKEFALDNMDGFVNSCGIDTPLKFEVTIDSKTGEKLTGINSGIIRYLIVDSDNSNLIAENARAQKQIQVKNKNLNSEVTDINYENIESINTNSTLETKSLNSKQLTVKNSDEIYVTKDNKVKKIMPVTQMLQENKIDISKVVGDINLETVSEIPTYVFEVKEQRKLLWFIPIGEKITEKRISATKEIIE